MAKEEVNPQAKLIKLPGEKEIELAPPVAAGYFPMDDYFARDYKPLGGRDCHFCTVCKDYYIKLHDAGHTREPFMPTCRGDLAHVYKGVNPDEFEPDEFDYYKLLQDPVAWAEYEFNWDARWYQKEILRCSSQFKAIRAGRRVGKTECMAILILWNMFTNGGLIDDQFEVLVIAPYQPQVAKIFDTMRTLISRSETLSRADIVKRNVLNPQLIELHQGGIARGWSSGSHAGAKSDKIRGQDANMIVIDEVDYVNDSDIEVIMAILASHSNCQLIVASTPTGIRKKLHSWCTNKDQKFKEFWFISSESPSWTPEAEYMFKTQYSQSGYNREFLAEFGHEAEGVFRSCDINAAIADYNMDECSSHNQNKYVIGVDWNKITGTHIVVVEAMFISNKGFKYRVVEKQVIRRAEFQQLEAIKIIKELDIKWGGQSGYIYVDAGYGHVQVEMMWKHDVDYPQENTNYRRRVVPITMNQNMEIRDPVTGELRKKNVKQFMVDTSARALEQGQVIVPKVEDSNTRIIPDEITYANIGLVQQMRDFKIIKYSPTGIPSYSQDYEHTLTAWMLAMMGHLMEYSDIVKINTVIDLAYASGMGNEYGKEASKIPGFDFAPSHTLHDSMKEAKDRARDLRPGSRTHEEGGSTLLPNNAGVSILRHQTNQKWARGSRKNNDEDKKRGLGSRTHKPKRTTF